MLKKYVRWNLIEIYLYNVIKVDDEISYRLIHKSRRQ